MALVVDSLFTQLVIKSSVSKIHVSINKVGFFYSTQGAWYQQLESSVKFMTQEALGALAVDSLFTEKRKKVIENQDLPLLASYLHNVGRKKPFSNLQRKVQTNKFQADAKI